MKSIEVRCNDKVPWPDHRCRPNHEPAADSRESESSQLRRHHEKDTETDAKGMIIPQLARYSHVKRVRPADRRIRHDNDESVFLYIERTRVEADTGSPQPAGQAILTDGKTIREKFAARVNNHSTGSFVNTDYSTD